MRSTLRTLWHAARAGRRPTVVRRVAEAGDLIMLAHWADKAPLRLEVPTQLLRSQGAFAYGPDHPFVRALTDGKPALEGFYAGFQPATLGAVHGTASDLEPWRLPWRLQDRPKAPPGEWGLPAEEGLAFWGPCSERKIALEMRRLTEARDGIAAKGFAPETYGEIEGHVLTDGTRAVFFVMGGKHRAAVLAARGDSHIRVAFRAERLALVDTARVSHWPMVAAGEIGAEEALSIAEDYLRGRGMHEVLA